jgi:hypothetical protein
MDNSETYGEWHSGQQQMKIRDTLLGIVFVIVAGTLSVLLALFCEGLVFQYGLPVGTPGMYVDRWLFPPSAGGLPSLGRSLHVILAIDWLVWFSLISIAALLWYRNKSKWHSG